MDVRRPTPLKSEDYPTQRSWIGSLFTSLNPFLSDVGRALNANLTFGDNIAGTTGVIQFSFTGTATDFPKRLSYAYGIAPREVRVLSCTENGTRRLALVNWNYADAVVITELVIWDGTQWRRPLTGAAYALTLRAHP